MVPVDSVSELNKRVVRLFVEAVVNEGRLELIDELIAADYLGRFPCSEAAVSGPEGVRRLVSGRLADGQPDLHVTIVDQVAEDVGPRAGAARTDGMLRYLPGQGPLLHGCT